MTAWFLKATPPMTKDTVGISLPLAPLSLVPASSKRRTGSQYTDHQIQKQRHVCKWVQFLTETDNWHCSSFLSSIGKLSSMCVKATGIEQDNNQHGTQTPSDSNRWRPRLCIQLSATAHYEVDAGQIVLRSNRLRSVLVASEHVV